MNELHELVDTVFIPGNRDLAVYAPLHQKVQVVGQRLLIQVKEIVPMSGFGKELRQALPDLKIWTVFSKQHLIDAGFLEEDCKIVPDGTRYAYRSDVATALHNADFIQLAKQVRSEGDGLELYMFPFGTFVEVPLS